MSQSKLCVLLVVAAMLFVTFGLIFSEPSHAILQALTYRYKPHPGKVIELVQTDDEITGIEYSYTIDARRYFGNTISHCTRLDRNEIERATGNIKLNCPVTVYADPKNPRKCVLIRGLTQSSQFGLAWSILAGLGVVATIFQFTGRNRSKDDLKRGYEGQVEYQCGVKRLRMVPGGFKTPASVATTCLLVFTPFVYVPLEVGDRWLGWWNLGLSAKIAISSGFAFACAVFDYFYTLRGNERGRWDLIVDEKNSILQLPAIGAYGEPSTHKLEEVCGLQLKTMIRPEDCDNNQGFHRLYVVCHEQKRSRAHQVPYEKVTAHTVAQSHNRTELVALAEWLGETLKLDSEVEEAVSDGTMTSLLSELNSNTHESYR